MRTSTRIFTKLTLIPINLVCRSLFLLRKEKTTWRLTDEQQQTLSLKWNELNHKRNLPSINFHKEKDLIEYIKKETVRNNENNITRTSAYLSFFKKHPEIHWAFLAHMVSRNAGYFMTDLKGEYLPHLIDDSFSAELFLLLEKGNSIIFQDAYPQLLLYEESKARKKSLFQLCKFFNVSPFMEGVWDLFFQGDRSPLLPVAQIINEQSHIEQHLVNTEKFQALISQLSYRLQEWLQLSQILFPVLPLKKTTGKTMQSFDALNERIGIGQHLYVLLFQDKNFHSVFKFACENPHTGSRADYDPKVFTPAASSIQHTPKEKLSFFKTKTDFKLYSPKLLDVWKETYKGPFFTSDWFTAPDYIWSEIRLKKKPSPHIWMSYWAGLHKIETAYLLKEYYRLIKKNRGLNKRHLFK